MRYFNLDMRSHQSKGFKCFLKTLWCYFGLTVLDLCKQIGIVPIFEFLKIICFCVRFHTKLQLSL